MNERDLTLIEQYYRAELSEAERAAFEKRLAEDTDFREEALLHAKALEAIRLHGRELFKQKLSERPLIKPKRSIGRWVILTAVLFLSVIFFYFQNRNAQSPSVLPVLRSNTTRPDSASQQSPPVNATDSSRQTDQTPLHAQDKRKTDTDKLFAAAFERYEDMRTKEAAQRSANTSETTPATLQAFLHFYQTKQYPVALSEFERLPEVVKKDGNSQFYYANALLASGKVRQAAVILDGIVQQDNSDFTIEAMWYSALCALKEKDISKAKDLLQRVISSKNKLYRPKAELLLREITQ